MEYTKDNVVGLKLLEDDREYIVTKVENGVLYLDHFPEKGENYDHKIEFALGKINGNYWKPNGYIETNQLYSII